jgi:hypothetical protein
MKKRVLVVAIICLAFTIITWSMDSVPSHTIVYFMASLAFLAGIVAFFIHRRKKCQ